jgi:hypothetical protein
LPGLPHKAAIRPLLPDSLIPPKNTLIPVGKFAVLCRTIPHLAAAIRHEIQRLIRECAGFRAEK